VNVFLACTNDTIRVEIFHILYAITIPKYSFFCHGIHPMKSSQEEVCFAEFHPSTISGATGQAGQAQTDYRIILNFEFLVFNFFVEMFLRLRSIFL